MNVQIRYGIAGVLAAVLLLVIAKASSGSDNVSGFCEFALLLGVVAFFAGIALVIVGLVRRPATRD